MRQHAYVLVRDRRYGPVKLRDVDRELLVVGRGFVLENTERDCLSQI